MSSRSKDIIFLLGAGASAEAGIPTSGEMIGKIEYLLGENADWKPHCDLYHHIKSAIHYAAGLKGRFNASVEYNIETLVNTLYELERNEQHPLYPFIAAWNLRFVSLAGANFAGVREFRRLILKTLKRWVSPDNVSKADYYKGFVNIHRHLTYPLRIFSLNYDLCLERLDNSDFRVESGFSGVGSEHVWDWERFEDSDTGPTPPQAYLYKLHGSINWKRDEQTKNLYRVEQTEGIEPEDMEVIFGRDFKLEAADPYLFYAYEFRRFTLIARLIVLVGYGFADAHINKMLAQALKDDGDRRLLTIVKCSNNDECDCKKRAIAKTLGVSEEQVIVKQGSAKQFLQTENLGETMVQDIPKRADAPF